MFSSHFNNSYQDSSKVPSPQNAVHTYAQNIHIPNVLPQSEVNEILSICTQDLVNEFYRVDQTDEHGRRFILDKLELVTKGHTIEQSAAREKLLSLAQHAAIKSALQVARAEQRENTLRELLVIRMGPGCRNDVHTHASVFTANLLLQDNPRAPGTKDGRMFSVYVGQKKDKLPDCFEDEAVGNMQWRHTHFTKVGDLHARARGVSHGVHPISGELQAPFAQEDCRFVLTYVYDTVRRNPCFPTSWMSNR